MDSRAVVTVLGAVPVPTRTTWPLIERMVVEGLGHALALGTDMADGALWARLGGGPGLTGFATGLRGRLETLGVAPATVWDVMGGSIARRLARQPWDATEGR